MRNFLRKRIPEGHRMLLVESGSRGILEKILPYLRQTHCPGAQIDLLTCYPGLPAGMPAERTVVYDVKDYHGPLARCRLLWRLARSHYSQMGIICSGELVLSRWKWPVTAVLPAKVFILNENADFFWLDYSHLRTLRQLALLRAGLLGEGAVRTVVRVALLPFSFLFLLACAAGLHLRRLLRRPLGRA